MPDCKNEDMANIRDLCLAKMESLNLFSLDDEAKKEAAASMSSTAGGGSSGGGGAAKVTSAK